MTPRPPFIPGIQLNKHFYHDAVRPILETRFPGLAHSAVLIGYGSDVLGFDTPMSTDHNWGPRLQLFLALDDLERHRDALDEALRHTLPVRFRGYSVNFSEPDWSDGGTQLMQPIDAGPVRHLIEIETVEGFVRRCLGITPAIDPNITMFFNRPYQVLFADRFANAIQQTITDSQLKNVAAEIGRVDQIFDCVNLIEDVTFSQRVQVFYTKFPRTLPSRVNYGMIRIDLLLLPSSSTRFGGELCDPSSSPSASF